MATPKKKPAPKKPIPKKAPPKPAPHPAEPATEEATTEEDTGTEEAAADETGAEDSGFTLPRGIKQEEYDLAKKIIVDGFANNAEPDQIKGAMFENGIPFSKMVRLYKLVTTEERLVIPAKEVKETVEAWFAENTPDLEALAGSYSTVDQLLKHLMGEVEGATPRVVIGCIRSYIEDNGYEMPEKPKGMGRTSAVAKSIVNAFAENTELSFDEYKAMLEPITTEKSINRWLGLYKSFSLIAAGEPFPA